MRTIADAGDAALLVTKQTDPKQKGRLAIVVGEYGSGYEFNDGTNKTSAGYTVKSNIISFDHPETAWGYEAVLLLNNNDNSLTGVSFKGLQVEISYGIGDLDMTISANDWIETAPMWVKRSGHARGSGVNQIVLVLWDRIERTKYEKLRRQVTRFDWNRNIDGSDEEKYLYQYLSGVLCKTGVENQFHSWNNEAPADEWAEIEWEDEAPESTSLWNSNGVTGHGIKPDWTYFLKETNTRWQMMRTIIESSEIVGRMERDQKYHTFAVTSGDSYDAEYDLGEGNHQWYDWFKFDELVNPNKFHIKAANQDEITKTHDDYDTLPFDEFIYIGDVQTTQEAHRLADQLYDIAVAKASGGFMVCKMDMMLEVHDRIKANDTDAGTTLTGYASKVHRIVDTMSEENRFRCEVTLGEMPTVVTHPLLALAKFINQVDYGQIIEDNQSGTKQAKTSLELSTEGLGDKTQYDFVMLAENVTARKVLAVTSGSNATACLLENASAGQKGRIVIALEAQSANHMCWVLRKGLTEYGPSGTPGQDVYAKVSSSSLVLGSDLSEDDEFYKAGSVQADGRTFIEPVDLQFVKGA